MGRAQAVPGVLPARGGPRHRGQPGPAPAAAADGNGSQPPGQGRAGVALLAASVTRVAAAAAAATFAVHAVREAIYLSPGHGSEEPAAQ